MTPSDPVRCVKLRATLSAKCCAARHAARWMSGGRKGAKKFKPCDECELGARVLAELEAAGWQRPSDGDAPEVLPAPQRIAKARYLREHFDVHRGGELAPLEEVALASRGAARSGDRLAGSRGHQPRTRAHQRAILRGRTSAEHGYPTIEPQPRP